MEIEFLQRGTRPNEKSNSNDDAHNREKAPHDSQPGQQDRPASSGPEIDTNSPSKHHAEDGRHQRREHGSKTGAGRGHTAGGT
ncbi:hypothetical protein ACIQFU_24795 [Streptomyces sp. NPDC093065]|uniref:hypothetical protein n=1 Tax=Streptomyces sp. NPDC093065 TaxID=3366021 RepID=UPI0037FAFB3C